MKSIITFLVFVAANSVFADTLPGFKTIDGHLADNAGMTLYVFDKDTPGKSNCNEGCAKIWPPLFAPPVVEFKEPLSVLTRADGSVQIAYNKRPLYFYADDEKAGDINGDGIQGIWHIVQVTETDVAKMAVNSVNAPVRTDRVVLHCSGADNADKVGWEVFVLAREVLALTGGKLLPVQLQLVKGTGKVRFLGGALGRLYPDGQHTLNLVSPSRTGKVVLSAPMVKIDPTRPVVIGATLEADIWNKSGHLKIPKTNVSCRIFSE